MVAPPPGYISPYNNPATLTMTEMAIAASYGIPKPKLPLFSSGWESDFIMLKKGLDGLFGPHRHLTEDYKYQEKYQVAALSSKELLLRRTKMLEVWARPLTRELHPKETLLHMQQATPADTPRSRGPRLTAKHPYCQYPK